MVDVQIYAHGLLVALEASEYNSELVRTLK